MRANAQLLESAIAFVRLMVPPRQFDGLHVAGSEPGGSRQSSELPLTLSLGEYPASSAVASTIALNVEPVWRPSWVTGLNSVSANGLAENMARTPPVRVVDHHHRRVELASGSSASTAVPARNCNAGS